MTIKDIQVALSWLGYRPGALDGVWGRKTAAALRQFQSNHGLDPDGIAGPMTLAALFPNGLKSAAPLDDPALVWFQEARRLVGVKETPGAGSSATILDWAGDLGIPYKGDDIPWCGLFVGHCISATLDREPVPSGLLSARSWQAFGVRTDPTAGAVMVFWRKSPGSGLGHVGFYAGEDAGAYRILGGNQSDKVSLAWVAKDRLVSARWPASLPPPVPRPVVVSRTEGLSSNEA
jgi:uncharacterized protein (TIGR02594 family)